MNIEDYKMCCSRCGKGVGILSLMGGTINATPYICCIECLPSRLKDLERQGYNPKEIESVRKWMEAGCPKGGM